MIWKCRLPTTKNHHWVVNRYITDYARKNRPHRLTVFLHPAITTTKTNAPIYACINSDYVYKHLIFWPFFSLLMKSLNGSKPSDLHFEWHCFSWQNKPLNDFFAFCYLHGMFNYIESIWFLRPPLFKYDLNRTWQITEWRLNVMHSKQLYEVKRSNTVHVNIDCQVIWFVQPFLLVFDAYNVCYIL